MMPSVHYIWSYPSFPSVIPVHMASSLRVTHPSAMIPSPRRESSHRLACVKHSVSVHPEPGSNSSFNIFFNIYFHYLIFSFLGVCFFFYFHCPFVGFIFRRQDIFYQILPFLSMLFFSFFYFFYFRHWFYWLNDLSFFDYPRKPCVFFTCFQL